MEFTVKPRPPRISSSVGDSQWRGKYLRALRISPQNRDPPQRPQLVSRGRRCHTDPMVLAKQVSASAPIEIPVGSRLDPLANEEEDGVLRDCAPPLGMKQSSCGHKRPCRRRIRCLAWQDQVDKENVHLEEDVDDEGDEEDGDDDDDDDNDVIFEMEGIEIPIRGQRRRRRHEARRKKDDQQVYRSGRELPSSCCCCSLQPALLSESFVPPHQMIERDCFSLGIQYELKQRQPVHI